MASAVATAIQVLTDAGLVVLDHPLEVGGITFNFEAVLVGTGVSQDLVIIAGDRIDSQRLHQQVSALNRALDVLGSRRPVTLVLLGARRHQPALRDLEDQARCLYVDGDEPSAETIETALAILLPLELPDPSSLEAAPLDELRSDLPSLTLSQQAFLEASTGGSEMVREALRSELAEALRPDPDAMSRP